MADGIADDDAKLALALLRYRLIAEAVEAPIGARTALLREVVAEEHVWPDGRTVRVSLRTLQRWVKRFKHGGLVALGRAPRKDKGRTAARGEAAVPRVIALRHEGTARSTPTLIDIVERAGEVAKGSLRRSTLDRHLDRRGSSRRVRLVIGEKRRVRVV